MGSNGKPEFCENLISKKVDPLAPPQTEDPYEVIYAADEIHFSEKPFDEQDLDNLRRFEELPDPEIDEQLRNLGETLWKLFEFLAEGNPRRSGYIELVGRRVVAALWAMDPYRYGGLSLSELGKLRGIKSCRATLSSHVTDFSDRFGIQNRAMHTKESREKFRKARNRSVAGSNRRDQDDARENPAKIKVAASRGKEGL